MQIANLTKEKMGKRDFRMAVLVRGPDYIFARSMLITSSDVITPFSLLWLSTTGRVTRLYLSNNSATSFSSTPSWEKTSGSWVRESIGVVGGARTILARGTAPTSVPWESTR